MKTDLRLGFLHHFQIPPNHELGVAACNARSAMLRARVVALNALMLFVAMTVCGLERLDRGVVALRQSNGQVYVGWRLLAADPTDVAFDVYRAESADGPSKKLNSKPVLDSSNFVDTTAGGKRWHYFVRLIAGSRKLETSRLTQVDEGATGFIHLQLQGKYRAQKVGLADFDGDGRLDYLVKQPDFNCGIQPFSL